MIEPNSPIVIGELGSGTPEIAEKTSEQANVQASTIRQLQLANLPDSPLAEFLSISFTHHIRILENVKDTDERLFYIRYCHNLQDFKQPMGIATYKAANEMDPELLKALPPKEELQRVFEESSTKEEKEEKK